MVVVRVVLSPSFPAASNGMTVKVQVPGASAALVQR
jgi:hypothetical protein